MIFYPFWAYSAFISANRDEENSRPLANWFGPVIVIAAVVNIVLLGADSEYMGEWSNGWLTTLFFANIIAMLVQILPTAQAVLRLNQDQEDGRTVTAKNSRFNIVNIITIILFPLFIWFVYWEA